MVTSFDKEQETCSKSYLKYITYMYPKAMPLWDIGYMSVVYIVCMYISLLSLNRGQLEVLYTCRHQGVLMQSLRVKLVEGRDKDRWRFPPLPPSDMSYQPTDWCLMNRAAPHSQLVKVCLFQFVLFKLYCVKQTKPFPAALFQSGLLLASASISFIKSIYA